MADIEVPSEGEVAKFHTNADTDGRAQSAHHTLGYGATQASPGNHTHDGGTSKLILEGDTITGAKGGNTALASVIALLVKLGASDVTT